MKLSDYDLRQIDEERINHLSETAVKNLSITLLNDLKEARERLNQNSKNAPGHWGFYDSFQMLFPKPPATRSDKRLCSR